MPVNNLVVKESVALARSAFKSLDFYVVLLGLALCRVWVILCSSAPFMLVLLEGSDWLFLLPGAVATLCLSLIMPKIAPAFSCGRRLKVSAGILVGLCTLGAPLVATLQTPALATLYLVTSGMAACCLQVLWGVSFAQRPAAYSLYGYPTTAIVTALMAVVVFAEGGLFAFCLFPVTSFLLLLVADNLLQHKQESPQANVNANEEHRLPQSAIVRLLLSIGIFSFLCRLFETLPELAPTGDPLNVLGISSMLPIVAMALLFLTTVILFGKVYNPISCYRAALPLMALGLTVVALFLNNHWLLSALLIGMGFELFDELTWILLVAIAQKQRSKMPSWQVFGLGTAATMLGMGLGCFASDLMMRAIEGGTLSLSSIGIISLLLLIVTAALVLPEGTFSKLEGKRSAAAGETVREKPETSVKAPEAEEPSLKRNCGLVGDDYGLTPREREVLVLLSQGRTATIIMRDLGIAKSTAQTHIENVYRKLDVHKQQELIDLVERYEPN